MKLTKGLLKKIKSKAIVKSPTRVTVVENQRVYTKDKSRFFKTAWEIEKKELYFND